MGKQAFKCKYDKLSDKKIFTTPLVPRDKLAVRIEGTTPAHQNLNMVAGLDGYAAAVAKNNMAIDAKYNGEIYFTKVGGTKCKHNNADVYVANNTLLSHDQGGLGLLTGQVMDIGNGVLTGFKGAIEGVVDCSRITVNNCYEQGLKIEPLEGSFEIHVASDDIDSLKALDYLKNNPHGHSLDQIPAEYVTRIQPQCSGFENIDEYSNYMNSIKEFNGPNYGNYISNIYYSTLFIFLFYILIKLYVKKK